MKEAAELDAEAERDRQTIARHLAERDELPAGSEFALTRAFVEEARDRLRWSPGLEWQFNLGSHWDRDTLLQRFSIAKRICKNAARKAPNESLKRRLASQATVAAIPLLARDEEGIATPVDAWDSERGVLNTPGGAIDLREGKVARGKHLFRQVAGVAPDPNMRTPHWNAFVDQVCDGDAELVAFLQRLAGYCLTGEVREQKLFFLYGAGANGKSVFLDALAETAGSYAHKLPADALMSKQHEQHPTMYASLHGKRLAVSSELEANAHWAEARIKELTGDAAMTARYMRQDFFSFALTHKHLIAGNFKPRLRGDDYAMARRVVLIPFVRKFTGADCDPRLPARLRDEHPGILAWAIRGAVQWYADGLSIPPSIANATEQYLRENDDVEMWLADRCTHDPKARTRSAELYESFRQWKEAAGEHAPSNKAFSQALERKGFERIRERHGTEFVGVRLGSSASAYAAEKWGAQ